MVVLFSSFTPHLPFQIKKAADIARCDVESSHNAEEVATTFATPHLEDMDDVSTMFNRIVSGYIPGKLNRTVTLVVVNTKHHCL